MFGVKCHICGTADNNWNTASDNGWVQVQDSTFDKSKK